VNGKLIAIEGIDGSGKSTLVKYLEDELKKEGHPVEKVVTREADKEGVFQTAVDSYAPDTSSPAYMFFFQLLHADKATRARKALEQSKIVIADRWDLSFFAWHENFGFFSHESSELREGISHLAFGDMKPDLGIYLDVSVEKAIDRRMWRGELIEDTEAEKQFYTKVVTAYRLLAQQHGWIIVDANDGFEQVRKTAWDFVQKVIQ
jgi:dTMP kinase